MAYVTFDVHMEGLDAIAASMEVAVPKAEHILAVQVAKDTDPYVPARTKSLANSTRVDGSDIIYRGPESRYLYNGKLMVDPNTGSAWAANGVTKVLTGKDLQYSTAVHSRATSFWFEVSKAQNLEKWVRVAGRAYGENL